MDTLTASTLDQVRAIASYYSGIDIDELGTATAIHQDLNIGGDDVFELARALAKRFGEQLWQWPWHRYVDFKEGGNPLEIPWFIWRLLTWPFRGRILDPSPFERLELGHIAAVIDRGEWFEP